ncbi:MAG: SH3 domain-containing protein [Caldilineales bacterium]
MISPRHRFIASLALALVLLLAMLPSAALAAAPAAFAPGATVTVTASALNVRSGPATSAARIGLVSAGTQLQVVAVSNDGAWLQVCCINGSQGWVSASYVAGVGGAAALSSNEPVVSSSGTVNLRSGPGTAFSRVGTLRAGQTLRIVGKNSNATWWQVEASNGKAWVAASVTRASGPLDQVPVAQDIPQAPAAAAAPAAPAAPVASGPTTGSGFAYGIQVDPNTDLGGVIGGVQGLGFSWVKFQLPWKDFEGAGPGQRNWPDDKIGAFNAAGLNILVSIVKAPNWARPGNTDFGVEGPPSDPATYASFVGEFAGRYCGRVQAIEVWNEQNLHYEWGNEAIDAARYMRLLAAAYNAIKGACPSIQVISGAPTPTGAQPPAAIPDFTYLEQMYRNGLKNYSDGIGVHPSGYGNPPDARVQDFQAGTYNRPSHVNHASFYFRNVMEQYRNIMVKYGDNAKLWPTEFGWASSNSPVPGYEYAAYNSEQDQANYIIRAYQMMRNWGWVGPAFLWNLNYNVTHPGSELAQFGIQNRPAYYGISAARGNGALP